MKQISFADAEYAGKRKKTRREVFLDEMEQPVPVSRLAGSRSITMAVAGKSVKVCNTGRREYRCSPLTACPPAWSPVPYGCRQPRGRPLPRPCS